MTPVRVVGMHEVARGAAAVLVVQTLEGDRRLAFHVPPGEAARVARVLGLARCRRAPIYELVRDLAASLGGRVSGAPLRMGVTAASVGTHLLALASGPALFVALAPPTTPVPAEVLSPPVPV